MANTKIGPVMLDLKGLVVEDDEVSLLQHPSVGGVILFSRNFESTDQVQSLIEHIRRINTSLLIAVDQEGGRVQRFREGLSVLPALAKIGELFQYNPELAIDTARKAAWLMAAEMITLGVDLSFAPVLDLNYQNSAVIGDRAFSSCPDQTITLGTAYIEGMSQAGMASTGKHFPGHGYVAGDSHTDIPRDERSFSEINSKDLLPYQQLFGLGLSAVMPAHVIYTQCDDNPAGFSRYWLQSVLREKMQFDGVIFSDDLAMEGATVAGDFPSRARAALTAGCDMVLVCNDPQGAAQVLDAALPIAERSAQRLLKLRARPQGESLKSWDEFKSSPARGAAQDAISSALNINY
ncbi:MAG: beta-N-acetylhexosaminidase [Pseudomonadales bacterium]|nr:beta-N-acetylhexosaminidase [Pseudomonadales bacterium]